jgi:hypothetical protein
MIAIGQPRIARHGERSRLVADVTVDGLSREVWLEVDRQYEHGLCNERSDAYVAGLLSWAMRNRHDIECAAPIGEELFYQLTAYLVPALAKGSGGKLHASRIFAPVDTSTIAGARAVGTGMSCGIDSFHVLATQLNSPLDGLRLTHLLHNNVGAFDVYGARRGLIRAAAIERAAAVARECGLPLIVTDSNYADVFPQNHLYTNTFSSCFPAFALQKLLGTYFYASVGHDFSEFRIANCAHIDSASYDLLTLGCFSSRSLRFYSEGGAKTRFEKTLAVADCDLARRHLHVCLRETYNCGQCMKCRRTLLILDALGRLDDFSAVFDLDSYRKRRHRHFRWMIKRRVCRDTFLKESCRVLRGRFSLSDWCVGLVQGAGDYARERLRHNNGLRLLLGKGGDPL